MNFDNSKIKELVETLIGAVSGFSQSADAIKNDNCKEHLKRFTQDRQKMIERLSALGELDISDLNPRFPGTIHRGWITLKGVLNTGDDRTILEECEMGEKYAIRIFTEAANSNELTPDIKIIVSSFAVHIQSVYNELKLLRDSLELHLV